MTFLESIWFWFARGAGEFLLAVALVCLVWAQVSDWREKRRRNRRAA